MSPFCRGVTGRWHFPFCCTEAGESFKCEHCGKVFAYKYYRDKHLKYTRCVDQGNRKFPCHLCNRSFEKRDRLRIHILHVHEKHRPHKVSLPRVALQSPAFRGAGRGGTLIKSLFWPR